MINFRTVLFFLLSFSFFGKIYAQLPLKVVNGKLLINDGSLVPKRTGYNSMMDSLDRILNTHPGDTTALFYKAVLLDQLNSQMAKPWPADKGALLNLTLAKELCEKAIALKMNEFKLKVLRAQVCRDLVYRFSADESWRFNAGQLAERKALFYKYKDLANKCYDELALLDKKNAYDYVKLKVTNNYPL